MGKPIDGMAVLGRFCTGNPHQLQVQGGRHSFRREAGLRVLRSGAQLAQDYTQSIRQQLPILAQEVEAHPNKIGHQACVPIHKY